jgi:hypothetical protein
LVLVASGCGTAAHVSAVAQATRWADANHVDGRVSCSSGLKPPSALSARADFICLVRRSPLDCTVLHVSGRYPAGVKLLRQHGDCVQPL